MSQLSEISEKSKKVAVWFVLGIIGLFVLQLLVSGGVSLLRSLRKPSSSVVVLVPPDTRFQRLPRLSFSKEQTSSVGIRFTLRNIDGKPPETTPSARVYSMPKKMPTLLMNERAEKFSGRIGFTAKPKRQTSSIHFYTDPRFPTRTMFLDIVNMNFRVQHDFSSFSDAIINNSRLVSETEAISVVKSYVAKVFDASVFRGKTTSVLQVYHPDTQTFTPALSIAAADVVRIDFFRPNLNGMPVVTSSYTESPIYALYAPLGKVETSILDLSYTFWPVASDDSATYPLRSAERAWEDLLAGDGRVVHSDGTKDVVIRDIFLAYYDSYEAQLYLQPVFVFTGDTDFAAYVPAVEREWLE